MALYTPIVYINNGEPLDQATLNRYVENIQENLEEIISRLTDVEGVSGGEVDEIPNTLALRDSAGTTKFSQPTEAPHPIRLADTSENADPDTVPMRNANGTFSVSAPTQDDHPVRKGDLNVTLPIGLISMWSGSQIPDQWALCDGTNGTPDLRDKFIVGSGGSHNVGATGGSNSKTSSTSGSHNHGGTQNHTLTTNEIPPLGGADFINRPGWAAILATTGVFEAPLIGNVYGGIAGEGWSEAHRVRINPNGGGSHSHGIPSAGGHTHTVDVRPPYYALAFIMYTG